MVRCPREEIEAEGTPTRIAAIEAFVSDKGFRDLGSDTPEDNILSEEAHRGWGFAETERVVYFRKSLGKPSSR